MNRARVGIAGGGIGGMALAIGLRQRGFEVTVFERVAVSARTSSGLVLACNGMNALAVLSPDVAADVRAVGAVFGARGTVHPPSLFLTPSGRRLMEASFTGMEERYGAPIVSLLRSDLQKVLDDHAERAGTRIVRGVGVEGFRQDASGVELEGPDAVRFDVLIGADGLRSRVRAQLLGDGDPQYRGYSAVRGVGAISPQYPSGSLVYGRGMILFSSPIDERRLYWVASIVAPAGTWTAKTPRQAHADLLSLMRGWEPALVLPVAEAEDVDRLILTDVFDRDPVQTWHQGRVALLGDAAHPMVYTMGQGANQALEDAVVLSHELGRAPTVEAALAAYVRERAPRTANIVKQSRMFGRIGHAKHPVAAWLRDQAMALANRFGNANQEDPVMAWRAPS